MIATALRAPLRTVLWLGVFAAILAAWWAIFGMARMAGVDWLGRPVAAPAMAMNGYLALFAMWSVMMAAMMLPTMAPTLAAYEAMIVSASGSRAGWLGVLAGYLAVWIGFAALIAAAQGGLWRLGLVDHLGAAASRWFAVVLLVSVGLYQFSAAKLRCHGVCHSPMIYFLGRWRTGAAGGARMGLDLGLYCVGCCWGFMALGFAGGVMSLAWMGLATLFMVLEKLPQIGHLLLRPAGAALIIAGLALAAAG